MPARKIIVVGSPGDLSLRDCGTREAKAGDIVKLPTWLSMTPFSVAGQPTAELDGALAGGVGYAEDGDTGEPCAAVHNGTIWQRIALGSKVAPAEPDGFPYSEYYGTHGAGLVATGGNVTFGHPFAISSPCSIAGIVFYSSVAIEFQAGLWEGLVAGVPTLKKSKTATAVIGYNYFKFSTPFEITWAVLRNQRLWTYLWYVGLYDTSGTNYYDNATTHSIAIGSLGLSYHRGLIGSSRSADATGFSPPVATGIDETAIDPYITPTKVKNYDEGPTVTEDYDPPVWPHVYVGHPNEGTINFAGTVGCDFFIIKVGSIIDGIRIYDLHTSAWNITVTVWNPDGVQLAQVSSSIAAPAGLYDIKFASPYTVLASDMVHQRNLTQTSLDSRMIIGYSNTTAPHTITVIDPGDGTTVEVVPVASRGALIYRYVHYPYMPTIYNLVANTFPHTIQLVPGIRYPIAPLVRAPA